MKLNCLRKGSHVKSKKRVGRGIGSGRGKTSSRGVKGQKARSGSAINGFEGGQQSIITSLPKRGFKSRCTVKPTCFNIGYIQKLYDSGKVKKDDVLDNQFFSTLKLIKSASHKVKILGKGDFSIPLVFKVNAVSDNAKNIIEKAGGSVEIYG